MTKLKVWFWIIGGSVLLNAKFFLGGLGVFGRLPWQNGELYHVWSAPGYKKNDSK
jgi:hypothetical protein